jgi:hypothetical protein
MRAIKGFCLMMSMGLIFSLSAWAQNAQPAGAPPAGGQPQGVQSQADGKPLDFNPTFDAMDTDHDRKITREEWFAAGMSQKTYDMLFTKMLDKDKDSLVTPDEFLGRKPQFEIDIDHDGKVSLKEYVTVQNQKGEEVGAKSSASAPDSSQPAKP